MQSVIIIGAVVVVLAVVGLIAFIMFIRAYRVAAPNEALVITGRAPAKKGDIDLKDGARIVVGGRAIVRPLFDRAHVLSLSSRQIQVEVEGYSLNGIFLRLKGVAQIKVGEEMSDIRKAAQRFLDQQDSIESYCQEILSGTLRAVVGTLSVEQVLRDRASFASQVQDDAAGSMNNQGLVIDTFQIISVEDDSDYLRDLGRPEAALVAKKARIAESESLRESTESENRDRQDIAESQKAVDLRNAEIQRETAVQRAAAAAAEELAGREQEQRILDEQQKIAEQKNDLRERELIGEVRKPADAQRYETERRADAERYKREQAAQAALAESENKARAFEIDARAQALSISERGRAEAEAVKLQGAAEASSISEKGRAEAEAVLASAEAYKQFNEAAVLSQILEALPKIAHELAAPYSNIESLSVVSSDGEAKLSKNVSVGMRETIEMLKSTTGLDLGEFLQGAMEARSDGTVHDRTTPTAAPTPPPAASPHRDAVRRGCRGLRRTHSQSSGQPGPVVRVRGRAGAEDRLPDPHHVGTLLDCRLVVPGHAHGQLSRSDEFGIRFARPITHGPQHAEALPHPGRVRREDRKRHEAAHTQGAELRQRLEHTLHGFGLEAVLLLFRGRVDLDVHVDPPTGRLQSAVQGLRDAQRVEGVELCGERGDIACLVPLEMPDDRPVDVQVGHLPVLPDRFLDLVLPQLRAACRDRQPDALLRHRLAHRQEPHSTSVAPAACRCRVDPGPHVCEVGREVLNGLRRRVRGMLSSCLRHDAHLSLMLQFPTRRGRPPPPRAGRR